MEVPYEIIEGQIVENKSSYEMQLNAINNKNCEVKKKELVKNTTMFRECTCGTVFIIENGIDICDKCFNQFDNYQHYLKTKQRNK